MPSPGPGTISIGMQTCDVLIVGGGPAGSACAWRLKRHGVDVLVMDRAVFPRDKVCAGWITPQVVSALDLDLADYARDRVLQPISGFRTGPMRGRLLEIRFDDVVSYAIRRWEFDHYLLQRSGARLSTGKAVAGLEREAGGWIVNGTVCTPMLVGAGGHNSPVARHLAAKRPRRHRWWWRRRRRSRCRRMATVPWRRTPPSCISTTT
jgi:flavin-dependent dehydrogenase